MGKTKLTPSQIAELRAAYEAWNPHDPETETADELAARFNISKQTMYTLRRRWTDEDSRRREQAESGDIAQLHQAIVFLTQELAAARARITELEAER